MLGLSKYIIDIIVTNRMKKHLNIFLVISIFFLINLFFNFNLAKEIFDKKTSVRDNIITEFLMETSYKNILKFKNPFITDSIFYPIKTNYSLNDPAVSFTFLFFFLRWFLNPHQIMLIIVLLNFFLNNFLMYLLLKALKFNDYISLLSSLIFGFTPFLSQRVMGHYTYIPIFFFPLTYLIILKFINSSNSKIKVSLAATFGIVLAFVLLSNFYYFFMILLGLMFYLIYQFFQDKNVLLKFFKKSFLFIIFSIGIMVLVLVPWLVVVIYQIKSEGISKSPGFGGAIELSGDFLSFFTPSQFNPIYSKIFSLLPTSIGFLVRYQRFFFNSWNKFIYPGIFIIINYILIAHLKYKKKLSLKLWTKIKPYFILSLFFAVLMLGPFLKIFNRWMLNLDGVMVFFPLPFLLFHYIPGLNTLRAPMRFTPIFVFFAVIVFAYCFNYFLNKFNKKKQIIFIILFLIIFFIDQYYVFPIRTNPNIPNKIYLYLKDQKDNKTVLEIPFTVRDGFKYIGFVHAIQPMAGQVIHNKPIIGGYLARVNESTFNYYKNLKFIGYLSKIIDKGNYDLIKEKPKDLIIYPFPYSSEVVRKEVILLNIKYIILKKDEKYSLNVKKLIEEAGFVEKLSDFNYGLFIYEKSI